MNKVFPKIGFLLIVIANANPVFAASKYQNGLPSNQRLDHQANSQEIIVAGLFDEILKTVDTIDRTNDRMERRERLRTEQEQRARERKIRLEMQQREREQRLQERQAREQERKRRQEEYAAARRLATQRQIEEVERRRQYFNSLSPEQKQAYIQQQQALRKKQLEASLFLLRLFLSNGSSSSPQDHKRDYHYIDNTPTPSYNPASEPVKPIDPFYGTCHHYSC
ncbi:hypothetical protein QUB80_31490 [Chlorogloeopsis sp. ULAP01]|nr:hypothetical protein [Chlorogloeopsis sp. ULAP01]